MPGLYDGTSGLWSGQSGLWDGLYGLGGTTPPDVLTGFDATFNVTNLVYDEENRLVTRTNNTGRRAVRGRIGHTSGKWYVELLPLIARFRFAGIVDGSFNTNGGGGPAGTNRVGIEANQLVAFGMNVPMGGFATPGTIVRIAYDADAKLLWLSLNGGEWNNNPLASPVIGNGGVSTAGLVGPAYVGATLRPVTGASVRYRVPGDLGYNLPAGFTEWSE